MNPIQHFLSLISLTLLGSSCGLTTRTWSYNCRHYSPEIEECEFKGKGTISFALKENKVLANIHSWGRQGDSCIDWPKTAVPYQGVDVTKSYKIQYLEFRIKTVPSSEIVDLISLSVLKISDGDRILYDASICPLHHDVMERVIAHLTPCEYYENNEIVHHTDPPSLSPNDGNDYGYYDCPFLPTLTWRCATCLRISKKKSKTWYLTKDAEP